MTRRSALLLALACSCSAALADPLPSTLVVYTDSATITYTGTLDTGSTSTRRFDFHAEDVHDVRQDPPSIVPCHWGAPERHSAVPRPACALGRGYDVTAYAPEGLGFAWDDCVLWTWDSLNGASTVKVICIGAD
jgi:hypothetical protein